MFGVVLRIRHRVAIVIGALLLATQAATAGAACAPDDTLFAACEGEARARLIVLPDDTGAAPLRSRRITVTGAYSSGDRFGIEGLALKDGTVISSRFQGWDGALLILPDGRMHIANVARTALDDTIYNLKSGSERRAFIAAARDAKLSVIQSHLLISEGALDVRDVPDAPRFQRRILIADRNGAISLFDSGTRALTLYEAAREIEERHSAWMALNLDMGSYDFCRIENAGTATLCGVIASASDKRLTNLLEFTLPPGSG